MTAKNPFEGRSISVVADLSLDEQIHLYERIRVLKQAVRDKNKPVIDSFRINDLDFGICEAFIEYSTRTCESSKSAAQFHRARLSIFDTARSSLNKDESYADTFNNLTGYGNRLFIVRSRLEGVCRWLEMSGREYALRNGLPRPSFISGGAGEHEHPTQEYLDELSFLEDCNWDRSHIHLAIVGDLKHGRTTHSKANGLKVFKNVEVDLIAPPELAMPQHYVERMTANGFNVRTFASITEYLKQTRVATKWYLTRLQLERMGEDIVKRQNELRDPVSFKQEYLSRLPAGTGFYHPLPRIKEDPILPTDLDRTALNRYDNQSINGMFTRIVLFGAVAGVEAIVADFNGQTLQKPHFSDDFIDDLGLRKPSDKDYVEGMRPITYGTVIDHICRGEDPKQIWAQLERVMDVMNFYGRVFIGVSQSQAAVGIYKGMIFIPDIRLGEKQRKKLAAVTPCTLNDIGQDGIHKYRLNMPPRVYGFDEISCRNPSCISYPDHKEGAPAEFHRDRNNKFVCMYCERPHTFKEIWG